MTRQFFPGLTLTFVLFAFVTMLFVGAFSPPAFAGLHDEEIKKLEEQLKELNKACREISQSLMKAKKENPDGWDVIDLKERYDKLNERRIELREKIAQLKSYNN